jgi:hypothetical protein
MQMLDTTDAGEPVTRWLLHTATYVEPVTEGVVIEDPRDDKRYPAGYPES